MAIPKSLPVSTEVYLMVKKKQGELIEKSGTYIQLKDVTNVALKSIINAVHLESDEKGWILSTESINKLDIE